MRNHKFFCDIEPSKRKDGVFMLNELKNIKLFDDGIKKIAGPLMALSL